MERVVGTQWSTESYLLFRVFLVSIGHGLNGLGRRLVIFVIFPSLSESRSIVNNHGLIGISVFSCLRLTPSASHGCSYRSPALLNRQ